MIDIERMKKWAAGVAVDAVRAEDERMRLSKILQDDEEYNRLIEIVASEHNVYNKATEASILRELNNLLLQGCDSRVINAVMGIERVRASYLIAQRLT